MKLKRICIIAMIGIMVLPFNVSAASISSIEDHPAQINAGQTFHGTVIIRNDGSYPFDGYLKYQL